MPYARLLQHDCKCASIKASCGKASRQSKAQCRKSPSRTSMGRNETASEPSNWSRIRISLHRLPPPWCPLRRLNDNQLHPQPIIGRRLHSCRLHPFPTGRRAIRPAGHISPQAPGKIVVRLRNTGRSIAPVRVTHQSFAELNSASSVCSAFLVIASSVSFAFLVIASRVGSLSWSSPQA